MLVILQALVNAIQGFGILEASKKVQYSAIPLRGCLDIGYIANGTRAVTESTVARLVSL